jgi:hypothetical protein
MNEFADFYNTSIKPVASDFIGGKLEKVKGSLNYIIGATFLISLMFVLVTGGSLIGLCKVINFPTICSMNPTYRKTFVFFSFLAMLFWGLYYITITSQTQLLEQINPGKFLSEDTKEKLKRLELTSEQMFIVANVFSIPIYIIAIFVIIKLLAKVLDLAGLKLF